MKITKQQLKQIIKEELEIVLEGPNSPSWADGFGSPSDWGAMGHRGPPEKSAPKETPREIANKTIQQIKQTEGWANMLPSQAWSELYYDHGVEAHVLEDVLEFTSDAELGEFIEAMLAEA